MLVSRFPTVIDGILTTLRADNNLTTVTISDGLPVTEDRYLDIILIGNSGDGEDTRAGNITQEYHDLAGVNSTRDETIQIFCAIISQTGNVDVATTRSRAFELLGYVSNALRNNYHLNATGVLRVELTDIDVNVEQFADGTAVRLPFTITATTLI